MSNTPLKIIFAGTPDFAAYHLRALLSTEHQICAVYTQPDRPSGRGKKLTPSPVKKLALEHSIEVKQPASLKDPQSQRELAELDCDIMIVVAYGLLLPKAVLDIPRHGCINVHGSILPRWRGAAPIQRAIEAGDKTSGVTIMQMDVGLDTGDMLLKAECPILEGDSTTDLHDRLCEIGAPALIETLAQIAQGAAQPEKQEDSLSNYARKIEKAEAEIDWSLDAEVISRKIRAFNPFPICFTFFNDERLRIHKATPITSDSTSTSTPGYMNILNNNIVVECGAGQLKLEQLQLPGKKAMSTTEFINGSGKLLGDAPEIQLGLKTNA